MKCLRQFQISKKPLASSATVTVVKPYYNHLAVYELLAARALILFS